MAEETIIPFTGRLARDPELRFSPQDGSQCAVFTIISNARGYDKAKKEWYDKEPIMMRCTVWGESSSNHIMDSLKGGDRVTAIGELIPLKVETKDGTPFNGIQMKVKEISASLRFNDVKISRRSKPKADVQEPSQPSSYQQREQAIHSAPYNVDRPPLER